MTDKELALEWVKNNTDESPNSFRGEELQEAFLAGLNIGRPKWHKVADGDLPNCEHGHTVFNQDLDRVIMRNGKFEYLDGDLANVIAWCEIPKYTEENLK